MQDKQNLAADRALQTGGQARGTQRRLCRVVRGLTLAGAVSLVLIPAWFWLSPDWVADVGPNLPGMMGHPVKVDGRALMLGALGSLPIIAVGLVMLWQLWQLFGHYLAGRVFTRDTLAALRGFALAMTLTAVLLPFQRTAMILALTLGNPVGQRLLVFTVDWQDYLLVLMGAVLTAMVSVMGEAVKLAEENSSFV
jgi:hypothetical protein